MLVFRQGYAEAEIEATFAKFDVDGDRVLDQIEQEKMQEDLDKQRAVLSNEMKDAGGDLDVLSYFYCYSKLS